MSFKFAVPNLAYGVEYMALVVRLRRQALHEKCDVNVFGQSLCWTSKTNVRPND